METRKILEEDIAKLVSQCPHTAADYLPLVIWMDVFYHDCLITSSLEEPLKAEKRRDASLASPVWHHQDFCSLYVVRQGRGTHIIDGVPYGVARGDLYTMGVGMEHYFVGCDNLKMDTIHFSAPVFDVATLEVLLAMPGFEGFFLAGAFRPALHQPHYGRWLHLGPDDYIQVSRMLAELKTEWRSGTPSGALLTRCLFLRLLVHLARLHAARPEATTWKAPIASARSEAIIAAAVHYMDEHFAEPIRISDIAEMVFLSHDRFTEVFTAIMGRTPRDYLHHLRLERAKTLLRSADISITEIAQNSGFGEVTYFIRTFREIMGMTPGAYRKQSLVPNTIPR